MNKIEISNKNYPKLLRKIPNPPKELYIEGKIFSNENCFAIVGTRRCSAYGEQVAWEIAGNLAEAGLIIVSGLAPGIDTIVHKAVIQKKKRTIAVLGTGLDERSIYPKENLKLAKEIIDLGGVLVSEYPPQTRGSKLTFPQRNRIISGLSFGVLVIEGKLKSGALITANWAKKQGRKVFAVPGSIYSLNSNGCHYLIKRGAKLVESANDILKELNSFKGLSSPKKELNSFKGLGGESEEEILILRILQEEALEIDKIIEKTNLSAARVASVLTNLEIEGKIRNLGGNIYAVNRC